MTVDLLPAHLVCNNCSNIIPIGEQVSRAYFEGRVLGCPSCMTTYDYWSMLVDQVSRDVFSMALVSLIGGNTSTFAIRLEKGRATKLTFSDYGVPEDAQIYRLFFTPVGDGSDKAVLFPAGFHGQSLPVHSIPNTLFIWPIPLPADEESLDANEVSVLATWAPHSGADDIKQILVDALFAVGRFDLRAAIIWANVAVETSLSRLLTGK